MRLLDPVIRQADSRLKYINCVFLNRSLQEAREREPDDIDLIAAICSAKNLDEETFRMLSLFGQVREALLAVKDNIPDKVLQNWREKAMMTKLNSGSIDYLASISLKEITREENKIEIIKESPDISLIGKKYQYREGMKSEAATQTQDVKIDSIQTANARIRDNSQTANAKIPLSQSMWASSRRPCSNIGEYKAKIPAYNVPGDDKKQHIKMIEGMLVGNKHLKEVKETFTNYNKWVKVTFDCETGRKEAMEKIEKKNREWFRMISIES
ncbi:12838_t:CDS:2 [Ambispora leptoticha]|uniref:12838_t:CDS:1 n=1 Tax=Ambispora leptoticha TaxID=144679 RepID=A0A9N9GG00_9GLOM|nr:12838_t:CDS:2 [Ambispora leptoticha]